MTPPTRLRFVALALLSAAAASCSDPVAPSELAGRVYAMGLFGRTALPALVYEGGGERMYLLADSLIFQDASRVTRATTYRTEHGDSTPRLQSYRGDMQFRVRGNEVEIGSFVPCPPNALCAANMVGRLVGGQLVIEPAQGAQWPTTYYGRLR